jgi:protein O-GlcNAc transferase
MKKIISYSLWGTNPKYTIGAIRNAELAKVIYPDWLCRFYTGNDVPKNITDHLLSLDAEVIDMNGTGWNGMFWRFLAADSDNIVISRDTDSRLNQREKFAVDEWLNSDKDFHIMRDHPHHATHILGGMWGARNGVLKGISNMIKEYDKGAYDNRWQVDQNFLREMIYPVVQVHSFVHDEFFENKPFPFKRVDGEFVGAPFDENDNILVSLKK